jgi:cell division protein FtsN
MKRNVGALATAVVVAGVAGALGLGPTAHAPRPASADSKPVLAQASPIPEPMAVSPAKSTVEPRHAPVPLMLKPRSTVDPPRAAVAEQEAPQQEVAKASDGTAPDAATPDATAPDTSGGSAAKAAVEADGYKGVKVLRKGDNGLWYAEGLRGSTKVRLTVDAQGTVTSE